MDHLDEIPDEALLASACDKLHNAESILLDLTETGPGVFGRFTASQNETLWYYRELQRVFTQRRIAPAPAIARTLTAILERLT